MRNVFLLVDTVASTKAVHMYVSSPRDTQKKRIRVVLAVAVPWPLYRETPPAPATSITIGNFLDYTSSSASYSYM